VRIEKVLRTQTRIAGITHLQTAMSAARGGRTPELQMPEAVTNVGRDTAAIRRICESPPVISRGSLRKQNWKRYLEN